MILLEVYIVCGHIYPEYPLHPSIFIIAKKSDCEEIWSRRNLSATRAREKKKILGEGSFIVNDYKIVDNVAQSSAHNGRSLSKDEIQLKTIL